MRVLIRVLARVFGLIVLVGWILLGTSAPLQGLRWSLIWSDFQVGEVAGNLWRGFQVADFIDHGDGRHLSFADLKISYPLLFEQWRRHATQPLMLSTLELTKIVYIDRHLERPTRESVQRALENLTLILKKFKKPTSDRGDGWQVENLRLANLNLQFSLSSKPILLDVVHVRDLLVSSTSWHAESIEISGVNTQLSLKVEDRGQRLIVDVGIPGSFFMESNAQDLEFHRNEFFY